GGRPIYLFKSVEQRNRGFELCVKNFKAMGLQRPPRFTSSPLFTFLPLKEVGGTPSPVLAASPDGKVRLESAGHKARLIDTATGKQIGDELDASYLDNEPPFRPFEFTCWSFSHDGHYVVTGVRYYRASKGAGEIEDNIGRILVWDVHTGE